MWAIADDHPPHREALKLLASQAEDACGLIDMPKIYAGGKGLMGYS
jgi:hypothetical protein